jgi:hypothetical protein
VDPKEGCSRSRGFKSTNVPVGPVEARVDVAAVVGFASGVGDTDVAEGGGLEVRVGVGAKVGRRGKTVGTGLEVGAGRVKVSPREESGVGGIELGI